MSYLVQMAALAVQNFVSAAAGIAVAIALIAVRAARNRQDRQLLGGPDPRHGHVLLPIAFVAALVFVWQGSIQNFHPCTAARRSKARRRPLRRAPSHRRSDQAARHERRRVLQREFRASVRSPNGFTNLLQILLIFVLGRAERTFGHMVKDTRQGWALFWAMAVMFLMGVFVAYPAEQAGNPISRSSVERAATATQSGGNMEGKETRFGISGSALRTVTTDASCGAVSSMHDSMTPLGRLVPLFNMQTDEVIFGGVGAGFYGMLLYAILGVFIAGLMVGRTPSTSARRSSRRK